MRHISHKNRTLAQLTLISAMLVSCGPDPAEQEKKQDAAMTEQQEADIRLLTNKDTGSTEIAQRLKRSLTLRDGMILIHDQVLGPLGSYTIPVTTPWSVECGMGLTVTFGFPPRTAPNDIGGGPEVHLSWAAFSAEACDELGPATGKQLQLFLAGQ